MLTIHSKLICLDNVGGVAPEGQHWDAKLVDSAKGKDILQNPNTNAVRIHY